MVRSLLEVFGLTCFILWLTWLVLTHVMPSTIEVHLKVINESDGSGGIALPGVPPP